jgi:hypothetical protein
MRFHWRSDQVEQHVAELLAEVSLLLLAPGGQTRLADGVWLPLAHGASFCDASHVTRMYIDM